MKERGKGKDGNMSWDGEPNDMVYYGRKNHRVEYVYSFPARRGGYDTTAYGVVTVCQENVHRIHYFSPKTKDANTKDLCKKGCWGEYVEPVKKVSKRVQKDMDVYYTVDGTTRDNSRRYATVQQAIRAATKKQMSFSGIWKNGNVFEHTKTGDVTYIGHVTAWGEIRLR